MIIQISQVSGLLMKYGVALCMVLMFGSSAAYAKTHKITSVGFTFTPSTLTVSPGDTIQFVLSTMHDAVQVSEATWNADGNTPNGGFSVPFGGGSIVLTAVGTHYYVCLPHATFGMKAVITVASPTSVATAGYGIPQSCSLSQNYPNPFNPSTTIKYELSTQSYVSLKVFDVLGREVATLMNGEQSAGYKSVVWNAANVPSGVYFYRLTAGTFTEVKKVVINK
jgi:plastocyanin